MSLLTDDVTPAAPADVGTALSASRVGRRDPTTWLTSSPHGAGEFVRATTTPDGPGTLRVRWRGPGGDVDADAWGPGAGWLLGRVPAMTGRFDTGPGHLSSAPDRAVAMGARRCRHHRLGATGDLYHALVPTVIEQRVTTREAKSSWRRLCEELGDPAPGPFEGLLLPPSARVLARQPSWWFHPLGIDRGRADTIREVARHAAKYWDWAELPASHTASRLAMLRGVGRWTIGTVLSSAIGDPDAVPVGDYHVKHIVVWALARRPRGTDEEMLELLEPYAGDRGRVVKILKSGGDGPPKFGPKQRILPMARW